MILAAAFTLFLALSLDTAFYTSDPYTFRRALLDPVITPLNNIRYNASPLNLAEHGLHPYYQHLVANLPQLLGPALPLLLLNPRRSWRLWSAACGIVVLSAFPHQEARFLAPAVPLLLSSLRLPRRYVRVWMAAWMGFNAVFGVLMGVYHQGGVVPAQIWLGKQDGVAKAFYWKTYSPPVWLVNGNATGTEVVNLMGLPGLEMLERLKESAPCAGGKGWSLRGGEDRNVVLAAPYSATFLDSLVGESGQGDIRLTELWKYRKHLNLDDLDIGEEGVVGTLERVVGRRGLVIWKVEKRC